MLVLLIFGVLIGGCLVHAEVASLQQSCSYSSADRTVRCDDVTTEVRIYRSGESSDRDVRYFSAPFHFRLGPREWGTYRVAAVEPQGPHSDVFQFTVDKHSSVAGEGVDLQLLLGLLIPLAVFLVLPVAGIDIILRACREQRPHTKQETSENIPLTSMSMEQQEQGQQRTTVNGQLSHSPWTQREDDQAQQAEASSQHSAVCSGTRTGGPP